MSRLEIALLGSPEIHFNGNPVQTDRRKAIALLAYMAVTGKSHSRDHLAGFLWPGYERDSAYAYLRRTLWELNKMLEKGWVDADREAVKIKNGADLWLDTADFENATKQLTSPGVEISQLETAISLYRGDFLSGFVVADTAPFDEWQNQQAEYFRRSFANTLEKFIELLAKEGKYETGLPYARRWLALDQLNESAHRAIMHLLAGMGDRTGAIRQYEACAKLLEDELGISPQPQTEEIYEAILHGDVPGKHKSSDETHQTAPPPASHLPQLPTPFIGRRPEVEQVKALITNPAHRLLTLIGPGGTGKTRLSIQAASEVENIFPDGVFFASLAPIKSTDAVLPTVAKALNFSFYQEDETPRQQLLNFLREKNLLLILDNFEHLLDSSNLITDILANSVDMKLLATSRVRLNVQGEQLFIVAGMRIPDVKEADLWDDPEEQAEPFSAVQLFLDRARRVRAGFRLTSENVQSVLGICRLVQGMPLGIELAAAWLELLSPEDVAAEISRSLDFLETYQADVPERQRSIRAVFESSWKLLSEDERDAFLRLCVFVGSFSREAAQQVSRASLKTLLGLVNKSWLQQTDDGRFQLHELMRQYGSERLSADKTVWREANDRHANYFADFVADQSVKMRGAEQPAGLKAIEDEFESNIKIAWDWLITEQRWDDIIDRMLLGLFQFGVILWRTEEMIQLLQKARLSLESKPQYQEWLPFAIIGTLEVFCEESGGIKDADPISQLAAIWDIVTKHDLVESMGFWFVVLAGIERIRNPEVDGLDKLYENAVVRLREQNLLWELGFSLLVQANWWNLYVYDEEKLLEARQIFKELGVIYEQGIVAQLLGRHAFQQRRPLAEIKNYFSEAMKFDKQLGSLPNISIDWVNLTGIYFQQGEIEQGFAFLHETQRKYERIGNMRLLVASLNWDSLYAVRYSTIERALEVRLRGIELAGKLGNRSDATWQMFELGDIYRVSGDLEKAMELYEQAKSNFEKMNLMLGLGYYQRGLGDIAIQQARYLDAVDQYQKFMYYVAKDNHLWSIGQAHAKLALANAYSGNLKESRIEIYDTISLMQDWREDDLILQLLLAEPVCLHQEGKYEGAVELAAFIAYHPISWNETKQQAHTIMDTSSHELPDKVVQSAIEQGKTLNLETVIANLIEKHAG